MVCKNLVMVGVEKEFRAEAIREMCVIQEMGPSLEVQTGWQEIARVRSEQAGDFGVRNPLEDCRGISQWE